MDLDEYCESVKIGFPGISLKADRLYDKCWNQFVVMEFSSYSWFESLANAVNLEMVKTDPDHEVILLLQDISGAYELGSAEIKKCN